MDTGANIIQYLNNNSILDYLDLSRNDQEQKKKKKKKWDSSSQPSAVNFLLSSAADAERADASLLCRNAACETVF